MPAIVVVVAVDASQQAEHAFDCKYICVLAVVSPHGTLPRIESNAARIRKIKKTKRFAVMNVPGGIESCSARPAAACMFCCCFFR